ncbi:MAG: helix-turn-helix transcriptional regulator [Candidatus Omnitrophota bacterium]
MSRRHNVENRQDFAVRLRAYRKEHNITQEQLARMLDASVFTINRWETAKHFPNASIIKLMKMLKILM